MIELLSSPDYMSYECLPENQHNKNKAQQLSEKDE